MASMKAADSGDGGLLVPGAVALKESTDPFCLSDGEADRLLADAPWRRFAVLGDSLAEGLGGPLEGYATVPWPDRVAEALRRRHPELAFANFGRRRRRTAQVLEQQLGPALEFAPDLVALVTGGNDLLAPDYEPGAVAADFERIVIALRERSIDVVTFTLWDVSQVWPKLARVGKVTESLNDRFREVSSRHDLMLVDMWGHPACAADDIYSSDVPAGRSPTRSETPVWVIHPSMRGHAVLAAETIRCLAQSAA
jgi:lysophospholipase L1-like esterase